MPLPTLTTPQRMAYRIGRGETSVLTFEPYKSLLLPLWRFRTVPIAHRSSSALYKQFLTFLAADDFIGMDMCRKFLQMGMTRAKRYANHKGGRKYDKETGVELEKSSGHEGMREKEEASKVFRGVWERVKADEGYMGGKERFLKEQKAWDKMRKREKKDTESGEGDVEGVKKEEGVEDDKKEDGKGLRKKVKTEDEDGNESMRGIREVSFSETKMESSPARGTRSQDAKPTRSKRKDTMKTEDEDEALREEREISFSETKPEAESQRATRATKSARSKSKKVAESEGDGEIKTEAVD